MGCGSFQAWAAGNRRKSNILQNLGLEELGTTLPIVGAFQGATTSGCEQNFAALVKHWPPDRDHMNEDHENAEATLILDHEPHDEEAIIHGAQTVWCSTYAYTCVQRKRADAGVPRPKSGSRAAQLYAPRRVATSRAVLSNGVAPL